MKRRTCLLARTTALTSLVPGAIAAAEDTQIFELRVYYAAEGKLDALHARFRDHTTKLFAKHGITNIGYRVPVENPQRKLVYLLAYPNREAREASWKGFIADPDWKAAQATSEKNGRLVAKIESTHLVATDFSPAMKPAAAEKERVFELRTYTASEGNLPRLLERFRTHTVRLFAKHGMQNLAYWNARRRPAGRRPNPRLSSRLSIA